MVVNTYTTMTPRPTTLSTHTYCVSKSHLVSIECQYHIWLNKAWGGGETAVRGLKRGIYYASIPDSLIFI